MLFMNEFSVFIDLMHAFTLSRFDTLRPIHWRSDRVVVLGIFF